MTNNTERTPITPVNLQGDILVLGQCPTCCNYHRKVLSPHESVVYAYIAAGWDAEKIGNLLCLSPKTIQSYKYRIRNKLEIPHGDNIAIGMMHHYMRERAIILKRLVKEGKEDVSPEFLAGYVQAVMELEHPDVRLINGKNGFVSERNPLPPMPVMRDVA